MAKVGDVVYVGRTALTDIPASVMFARGNVCVTVASVGDIAIDVSEFAHQIDRALSLPPAKTEAAKGAALARTSKAASVTKNRPVVLFEKLQKAAPKGGWLKVIVPDGELRRKGDALVYVSPEGGRKEVGVFAAQKK